MVLFFQRWNIILSENIFCQFAIYMYLFIIIIIGIAIIP